MQVVDLVVPRVDALISPWAGHAAGAGGGLGAGGSLGGAGGAKKKKEKEKKRLKLTVEQAAHDIATTKGPIQDAVLRTLIRADSAARPPLPSPSSPTSTSKLPTRPPLPRTIAHTWAEFRVQSRPFRTSIRTFGMPDHWGNRENDMGDGGGQGNQVLVDGEGVVFVRVSVLGLSRLSGLSTDGFFIHPERSESRRRRRRLLPPALVASCGFEVLACMLSYH